MTPRFKDFGGSADLVGEPLSFKLHDETFTCRPALQGKVLLEMVAKAQDVESDPRIVLDFFEKSLLPESHERFEELINSSEKIVGVEVLAEITTWLIGEYSSRPQNRPEPSQSGQ